MRFAKLKSLLVLGTAGLIWTGCDTEQNGFSSSDGTTLTTLEAIAQTSAQLASGASFTLAETSGTSMPGKGHGPKQHRGPGGFNIDGLHLLTPTNELLAIVDAESAGDFRGLRIFSKGGATITHYDASGNEIDLPQPSPGNGPEGCSFSGRQFPQYDSLLASAVKTVIDFGSGVTFTKDSISITRSGSIVITRSGDALTKTETITFDNYAVNGNAIEGTKTRVSTFSAETGTGVSITNLGSGSIAFADGTVATWTSSRERISDITFEEGRPRPVSGTITTNGSTVVKAGDGSVIYSHIITESIIEDVSCGRKPVSGVVETIYGDDTISVDFGDGTCESRSIAVTINGETTTRNAGR